MMLPLLLALSVLSGINIQVVSASLVDIRATIELPAEDVEIYPSEFSPFFKILNEINGTIYIGGKKLLVIYDPSLPLSEASQMAFENGPDTVLGCRNLIGPSDRDKICQHYIRLVEEIDSVNNTFLICGTNRLNPYCHLGKPDQNGYSMTDMSNFTANGKIQYSVVQNTTAFFNRERQQLFTGYNVAAEPNPSHIAKFTVNTNKGLEGLNLVANTDDQNEIFVNEPDFVGKPYTHGDFIYFFYRETAVEAVNQGKFVYSRVGRVCLNDDGFQDQFQTFFKARLNCSLQGDYPFYFNYIQDVIVEERDDDTIFYAVFTTTPHGPSSSAVCSYRLRDIIYVFENSEFKGKTSGKLPGPIARPSFADNFMQCNIGRLNPSSRQFQRANALMDDLVPNYNPHNSYKNSHPPLFYSTRMNLYSIAVDTSNHPDNIYYVGTEEGTILKSYFDNNGLVTFEQDIWDIKSAVTGLRFHNETQTLLAVTEKGLYRIHMAKCSAFCIEECNSFYHGYCEAVNGQCRSLRNTNNVEDLIGSQVRILNRPKLNGEIEGEIESCSSRKVDFTCEVKSSPICRATSLSWSFNGETLVNCSGGGDQPKCKGATSTIAPFIQFQEIASQDYYKLVHLSVDVYEDHTNGKFICQAGEGEDSVTIKLSDSKGCLTHNAWRSREANNAALRKENDALKDCTKEKTLLSSEHIMFQTCDQCPGDPKINDNT